MAIFTYPNEALALKGRLEADGIPVFLRDSNTLYTDPMVSNAIGGVKMDVYKEDLIRAEAIASKIHPELFSHIIECPKCNSRRANMVYTPINILKRLNPFSKTLEYKCEQCQTKFEV